MTLIAPFVSESSSPDLTSLKRRSLEKISRTLYQGLSELERENGGALVNEIVYNTHFPRESWAYKRRLEEIFASLMYSDECKRYIAVSCLSFRASPILLVADQFITEEVLTIYVKKLGQLLNYESYIKALMGSSNLSERLVKTILKKINPSSAYLILELTPNSMITPRLVSSHVNRIIASGWDVEGQLSAAALRVKQVHPGYKDFPDEWVLKVFCGSGNH